MRIYKYFPPERIDVVESARICFSSAKNLNDPFELKAPMQLYRSDEEMKATLLKSLPGIISAEYDNLPDWQKINLPKDQAMVMMLEIAAGQMDKMVRDLKDNLPALEVQIYERMSASIGVLCLTETPNNLLMWAHYAGSHSGFVVEFDHQHEFFNQRRTEVDELRHLRKVLYAQERPILFFENSDGTELLLTKSHHWAYEQEWRMFMALEDASSIKSNSIGDFHLFDFPIESVVSVTFGCRMNVGDKIRIRKAIEGHLHYNCRFYDTLVNPKIYELDMVEVS